MDIELKDMVIILLNPELLIFSPIIKYKEIIKIIIIVRNNLICWSLNNINGFFIDTWAINMKGKLPIIIKTIDVKSILLLLKKAKDSLWVENPPVDIVVKPWVIASNKLIPK